MGSEGPVVFWKGLKMSRKCLGVPRGCSCGSGGSWSHPEGLGMSQGGLGGSGGSFGGFRGSCCLLEGSEDVPEVSWGVQGVLMWVWGVLEPSRKFGGVPERPWRVQGVLLLIHGVHGFIQKGLEMSKKVPVGCRGSPGVSRASLQSSRRVWGCPRTVLEGPGSVHVGLGVL